MLELFLFGFLAGLLARALNCFLLRFLSGRLLCGGRFDLLRPPLLFHWPVTTTLRKVRGGYDGRLRNISDRRTPRLYRIAHLPECRFLLCHNDLQGLTRTIERFNENV